jgi:hypothetical protein
MSIKEEKPTDLELSYVDTTMSRPRGYALQEPEIRGPRTGLERKLVWKLDRILVPLLTLIYFVTFLVSTVLGILLAP